jgi:hypothetical protein
MKKGQYTDCHQAIKVRLTGQSVEQICCVLNRSHETQPAWLSVNLKGRVFKRWPYKFLDK